jgi:hypothetical protein
MSGFDDTHFPLPPRRTGWGRLLFAAVLAFVVGGAAAGWTILNHGATFAGWSLTPPHAPTATVAVAPVEAHLAMLEARLARLDLEAQAAATNAGRAEALLTALAARRALERGRPLGPLEEQLRLHFGASQPGALAVLLGATRSPVTISSLASALANLAPDASVPAGPAGWARVKADLSSLFAIRHEPGDMASPATRLERARVALYRGDLDSAIGEVRLMPGNPAQRSWIAMAQHYAQAEAALDQLDVSALAQPVAPPAVPAAPPA